MVTKQIFSMVILFAITASVEADTHCKTNTLGQTVCVDRDSGSRTVTATDSLGQEVTKQDGRTIQTCKTNTLGETTCRN